MRIINLENFNKMLKFLRALPEENFDFSDTVSVFDQTNKCGTVCCALGWTPKVFPELVSWSMFGVRLKWAKSSSYLDEVGSVLFNLAPKETCGLFYPEEAWSVSKQLKYLDSKATPSELAGNLEKFIELVRDGEIPNYCLPEVSNA